jgi:hypothetical protein
MCFPGLTPAACVDPHNDGSARGRGDSRPPWLAKDLRDATSRQAAQAAGLTACGPAGPCPSEPTGTCQGDWWLSQVLNAMHLTVGDAPRNDARVAAAGRDGCDQPEGSATLSAEEDPGRPLLVKGLSYLARKSRRRLTAMNLAHCRRASTRTHLSDNFNSLRAFLTAAS